MKTGYCWLRLSVVAALLAPYALTIAQEVSTRDLVKGNYGKYASVLKLAELPDGYSAVRIALSSGTSDPYSLSMPYLFMRGGGDQTEGLRKFKMSQCYWTNGDTVRTLNRDFLVTYRLDLEALEAAITAETVSSQANATLLETPEPTLKIDLISLDSIQSVSPCPEITKKQLVATFGKAATAVFSTQSAQATALSNVKQAALGMIMYANDYDDAMPYAQSTKTVRSLIMPYIRNAKIWKELNPKGGQILFNMGVAGADTKSIKAPADTVLFFESEPWSDGRRAVAFCDGHAKLVTAAEWATLAKNLRPPGLLRVKKPLPANYVIQGSQPGGGNGP